MSERAPWYRRAGPYVAAAAVVSAGLGVYLGASFASQQSALVAVEANRSMHTMAEALSLDAGRKRDYALMFGAVGLAVLCAIVAVFTW